MWFVLILCAVAAFADVIGGAITIVRRLNERQMLWVSGLGAGFLLGATILDRLPDSMQELPTTAPVYMVVGYLTLLLFERYGTHSHEMMADVHPEDERRLVESHSLMSSRAATVSFVGLLLHTFMDGVIIAGAFSISRATGFLMFLAITMHKIPEGFSMATITLASGASRRRAMMTSSSLALSTLVGAVLTLQIGTIDATVVRVLMSLATGTFLFVATTDLIPAIKSKKNSSMLAIVYGVVIFYISLELIKHVGLS